MRNSKEGRLRDNLLVEHNVSWGWTTDVCLYIILKSASEPSGYTSLHQVHHDGYESETV